MRQALGIPCSPRGVVVDNFYDYFNSTTVSGPPQNFLVATGECVLGQMLIRPNGVAGAIVSVYDGVDATGVLVYQSLALGTGDATIPPLQIRMKAGLFVQITAQQVKFILVSFRQ